MKNKRLGTLENGYAKKPRQEAPLPTVIVHPEEPLGVSIGRAVFDELDGVDDTSQLIELDY
jgi:hypothetical protein